MYHPTANKTLKEKAFWHLKVVAGTVLISLVFSYVLRGEFIHEGLPSMLVLTFLQLEIFLWLGSWFFQSVEPDSPKYMIKIVLRLLLFYLAVLVIALFMFLGIFAFHFIKNGSDFSVFIPSLMNLEMNTFFIATLVGFAFGAIFFFFTQWADALKRFQKLKEEKLIFQYETLKNQVNPHFLFNSLNTLSSLIRTDVDLSEEFIHKLSSVYRYVLENMESELVPVSTELKFVEDYFYLQKIRDQEKINLNIELNNHEEGMIPPVSVQMLVENALKHNVSSRTNPLTVTIHYEGLDKLVVRNDLQKKTQLSNSSKIGLKNLKERCSLILIRDIEIQETGDEYIVKLPVKMK